MKKLLLPLLFSPLLSFGQTIIPAGATNQLTYQRGGYGADSLFTMPIADTGFNRWPEYRKIGRITVHTDSNMYYHNGSQYVRIAKYSDVQAVSVDTSLLVHKADSVNGYTTPYDLTTGLSGKLNTSDSTLYATQYDISGKLNVSDSTLYSTQYDLTSGLAGKISTSAISQNYSDNSSATVPSSAALSNGLRTKVDTGSNGVYVYSRQQLYDALNYAKRIVVASDTITVDAIKAVKTGTTIIGLGGGRSKITATATNTTGIFTILSVNEVTIKDLELVGEGANVDPTTATGSFYTTLGMAADSNIGTSRGVFVNNVQRVYLTNLYIHNFTKAGIEVQNTGQTEPARMGLITDNVFLTNNYYGVYCANSGQYNTFSNIISNYNICGFGKRAGNITVTGSHLTNNRVGYFSGFGSNAAHGSIANSLINHSYLRAVYISNITSGEIVSGCHVYDAGVEVVASAGVQIYGCLLECPVTIDGVGTNTVHDNMLSLESGGGNISGSGTGPLKMYNNVSIPDRNNRTVNNDIITRLRAGSSIEVEAVTHEQNSNTTGMWDFRAPMVFYSGGILISMDFEGEIYGVPGTHFKLHVNAYPNTTTAITTAHLSATFSEVNGTLPFTRVSVGIAPDGQFSVCIGDTNTAIPLSRVSMTRCVFFNSGSQGTQVVYTGGRWTSQITNSNVGFTSVRNITPVYNLNTSSAINGANITDGTVTAAELASNSVTTVKVTDGNITLPKLATQLASSIVANATGGTASPTAVSIGVGLGFSGSTLAQSFTNTRSSAGTLSLQYATDYTFTGTTAIYTLPAISTVTGRQNAIKVKNAGSGSITVNTNGALNTLFNATLTNTMTIAPGEAYDFVPDGVNLNVY